MHCKKSDCFDCPYPDCINDYVKPLHPRSEEQKERYNTWCRERRDAFSKEGLCRYCGKRPPDGGYKTCGICRAYMREKRRESHYRYGVKPRCLLDGVTLCGKCGKAPPEIGYRLCKDCLASAREALDKTPTHNGRKNTGGFTEVHEAWWRARGTSTMRTAEQKARSE